MEGMTPGQVALLEHFTTYGQRGTTPDHRVRPHEWEHKPMVEPVTTPWHVKTETHQLPLLLLGFVPALLHGIPIDMIQVNEQFTTHGFKLASRRSDLTPSEDLWFIYADGPDYQQQVRIHMHDSWTGREMMELLLNAGYNGYGSDGNGARIVSITWENAKEERMRDHDADMYKEVAREVCDWVLNVKLGPAEGEDGQLDARRKVTPTAKTLTDAYKLLPPGPGSSSTYWVDYTRAGR